MLQSQQPTKIQNYPGKRVLNYTFLKELGKGAFGQVFSAKVDKTSDLVAIKCVPKAKLSEHRGIVGQLLDSEIEVLRQINSEHVIKFIDFFQSENQCYIVLEFCNSGDFEQLWIKRGKKIPENEVIAYMKQVLAGMQALHEKNVLHRDLKLPNILIHNSTLKIADLGFCKQLKDQNQHEHLFLGSLGNMAPEIVEQKPYGMAADMFSIGSMFYQLLFGSFPFTNINEKAFLEDIRTNKPNFRKNGVSISTQLEWLLYKMLMKDPRDRLKWSELYSHPLMKQKEMRYQQLSLNLLQAEQINVEKIGKFYENKGQLETFENSNDFMKKFDGMKEQQILKQNNPINIKETELLPDLQDEQVKLEITETEKQIEDLKKVEELIEKYMRLRDQIVYLSRTLNEINTLISEKYSALPFLFLIKKLYKLNDSLTRALLDKQNIFRVTDLLDKVYQNPHFQKFLSQMLDDQQFYESLLQFALRSAKSFWDEIQDKNWQRELTIECSAQFNQNFKEVLNDFIIRTLSEKKEKEKDPKVIEQYIELQIHLIDCCCYEKVYQNDQKINIMEQFDALYEKPLKIKNDIFSEKVQLLFL
ncbi:unnamed protein product (macronuclear) [Paramecium tetraurelia]|uniref:Protein kinase domain-containing protein n=1 Tax=Paramecium tetraurelia TaxID=5888 RepID=A0DDX0_PARTE|nr:uncharacterized protein GSPATT00016078001 [Paramecium tetraurelia]CAK81237.1 unnamed protein product [Paramecium tetraurelia]|eukprot:XP_001448634.1 hypothetical protein (macronuclear) [Paramecium tetraurelia strain d4-2]